MEHVEIVCRRRRDSGRRRRSGRKRRRTFAAFGGR